MEKIKYTKEEKEWLEGCKKRWEDKGFKVRNYKINCCHVTWDSYLYTVPLENKIHKTFEDAKKFAEEYIKKHECEARKINISCVLYDLYKSSYTTYKKFTYKVNNNNELEFVELFELNESSMEIIKKELK